MRFCAISIKLRGCAGYIKVPLFCLKCKIPITGKPNQIKKMLEKRINLY